MIAAGVVIKVDIWMPTLLTLATWPSKTLTVLTLARALALAICGCLIRDGHAAVRDHVVCMLISLDSVAGLLLVPGAEGRCRGSVVSAGMGRDPAGTEQVA